MAYILMKPCSEEQFNDFLKLYNRGEMELRVQECHDKWVALEPWEYIQDDQVIDDKEGYEKRKEEEEKERIGNLSMTRGDVFEAMILAKGKTKADLRAMIEQFPGLTDIERALYLNRFDEALDFFRKHPAIDLIGGLLGITPTQMNNFFITKDYHALIA